ncbi:serine/threonine-protein kinase [Streptomyces sp. NPDC058045]|uniref:serine/threonine-protein kinase n=1 Tax=Streptomyces sp. NPDC058045 TaxID=3346311 RepID=UPI0036E78E89
MRSEGTPSGEPDTVIAGRYRLRRQLGQGGMGVVWEALDTSLDRKVAVKGLLYPGAADPRAQSTWVSRARREAQAIARIGHQNVVAVHDVIEDGNQVWIVMELLDSRSLADLLHEQRQLSVPHAARIGLQVLRGLAAVHESGVLHRDVKPHNILFRPDGRALLMDFGIATFEGAVQVTRLDEIIGTPQYLAPELLGHNPAAPRQASTASDLWSLGVTLYEMVEGRRPFEGDTSFEIFIAVRDTPLPPLRYAGPLTSLIESLLQKDPALRPDAAEAERILAAITEEDPSALDGTASGSAAVPGGSGESGAPVEPAETSGSGAGAGADSGTGFGPPPVTPPPAAPDQPESPGQPQPAAAGGGSGGNGWKVATAVLCALLLVGTGWFGWTQWKGDSDSDSGKDSAHTQPKPEPKPEPEPGSENAFRKDHDELRIGVKKDQPGLSVAADGTYHGFEVDLAQQIGRELGFSSGQIKFRTVTSDNRSDYLRSGRVHLVLATYSISEQREKDDGVKFAGPYYEALKGLLVRKNRPYNDLSDLQHDKTADVCTARKSVYVPWVKKEHMSDQLVVRAGYEDCVKALLDPKTRVYAVATDDVIVAGLADKYSAKTKALESLSGSEGYGVAMSGKDEGLHGEVCRALTDITAKSPGHTSRWADLYNKHLKPLMGGAPTEPDLSSC